LSILGDSTRSLFAYYLGAIDEEVEVGIDVDASLSIGMGVLAGVDIGGHGNFYKKREYLKTLPVDTFVPNLTALIPA
jgi:hypothetical protein